MGNLYILFISAKTPRKDSVKAPGKDPTQAVRFEGNVTPVRRHLREGGQIQLKIKSLEKTTNLTRGKKASPNTGDSR